MKKEFNEPDARRWERSHQRGKIAGGLLIVIAGSLFLARELGVELPRWLFSWKTLLIGFAVVLFARHGFRRPGWIIPLLIGVALIIADLYPTLALKSFVWPVLIIMLGLFIIFKPRRQYRRYRWQECQPPRDKGHIFDTAEEKSSEDFIDSTSVMGGVKKNILSKKFRGGDITNVFGGTEINLIQADFEGVAKLEITQVFGGTKLIVPSNWQIQSDLVTVLGSLEDNTPVMPDTGNDPKKVLMLSGTTFFGGIEIKNY